MDVEDPQEWIDIPDDLLPGEKDVCKVCRDDISDEEPWVTPCKCTGSVKYIHTECLKTWLASSGKRHCDVCGHRYAFSKVYPEDVPSTIPPVVYFRHAIIWTIQVTRLSLRAVLVAFTWLVLLPLSCLYTLRSEISLSDLACALIIRLTQQRDAADEPLPDAPSNTTVGEAVAALANSTVASNSTVQGGLRLIDFVLKPVSSSWTVATSQWAKLLKGDYDAFAVRLLYLQGFTILLIALTIGLIFLREWMIEHDWAKYDNVPDEAMPLINPDDFVITGGISHRIQACDCPRCKVVKMVTEAITAVEEDQPGAQEQARLAEEQVMKVMADLEGSNGDKQEGRSDAEVGVAQDNDEEADPRSLLQQTIEEASGEPPKADPVAQHAVGGQNDRLEGGGSLSPPQTNDSRNEHVDIDSPNAGPGPQTAESRRRSNSFERQVDALLAGHQASTDDSGSAPVSAEEMRARRLRAFGGSSGSPAHAAAYKAPELLVAGQEDAVGVAEAPSDQKSVAPGPPKASGSISPTPTSLAVPMGDGATNGSAASAANGPVREPADLNAPEPSAPITPGEADTSETATEKINRAEDAGHWPVADVIWAEAFAGGSEQPRPDAGVDDGNDIDRDDDDVGGDVRDDDDGDWEDLDTQIDGDEQGPDQDLVRLRAEGLAVAIARLNREAGGGRGEDANLDGRFLALEDDEDGGMLDGEDEFRAEDDHLDDLDDAWWAREDLESILMLLGLIGPVSGLLTNLVIGIMFLTATNSILVGGPLIIGRILLVTDHPKAFFGHISVLARVVRILTDPLVDIAWEILSEVVLRPGLVSFQALESIIARKFGFGGESPSGRVIAWVSGLVAGGLKVTIPSVPKASVSHVGTEKLLDGLAFIGRTARIAYSAARETSLRIALSSATVDRVICVLVGHLAIIVVLSNIALVAKFQSGPLAVTVCRQIFKLMTAWKLIGFFVVELAVFPLVVGLVMNLVTVPLFQDATLAGRLQELRNSPFAVVFIAWITGTFFMFNFAQSLSWVRRLGRPGMMFFIRDPNDPDFKPVDNILEQPTLSQARKITTSLVMYSVLVWWLLGMGPWVVGSIPSLGILPLRYKGYGPISHTPFDLLFLLVAGENLVERLRALHYAKKAVALYWTVSSRALRLTPLIQGLRHPVEAEAGSSRLSELAWRATDRVFRLILGNYPIEATMARVPAVDTVIFPPKWGRRTPIFVPLTEDGLPKNAEDKLRIIKQDETARMARRQPEKEYTQVWLPKYWRTRVHVFTFAFAMALGVGITSALLVPLVVGRGLLFTLLGEEVHDGYSFIAGVLSLAITAKYGRQAQRRLVKTQRAKRRAYRSALSRRLKRSFLKMLKRTYVLLTLYGAYPLLRGMVFEVQWGMILRYGMKEVVPVVNVWDAWSLGLIFAVLRGVFRAEGAGPHGARGHWRRVGIHDIIRRPFGIRNIQGFDRAIRSEMTALAAKLMMPHLLSALAVALGSVAGSTARFRAMQYRCAGPTSFVVCAVYEHRRTIRRWAKSIRQRVLDAEYTVEERILNYVPDDTAHRPAGTLLTIDPPPATNPAAGEVVIEPEEELDREDGADPDETDVNDDGEEFGGDI